MPTRVIACFLSFVLLWSAFGTVEASRTFVATSPEQAQVAANAGGQAAENEGSVEHHHLDDLPLQAQNDSPPETLGLLPSPMLPDGRFATTSRRNGFLSAATGSPFLAGPLRPPCS